MVYQLRILPQANVRPLLNVHEIIEENSYKEYKSKGSVWRQEKLSDHHACLIIVEERKNQVGYEKLQTTVQFSVLTKLMMDL